MGLGKTAGAEELGLWPIEKEVGERDTSAGRSSTTVAAVKIDPGLVPEGEATSLVASLLSFGCFGSKSLIASADTGLWATSLSSATITA
jgi:hypothetical protein